LNVNKYLIGVQGHAGSGVRDRDFCPFGLFFVPACLAWRTRWIESSAPFHRRNPEPERPSKVGVEGRARPNIKKEKFRLVKKREFPTIIGQGGV
jgi:hypothetical protein